MSTKNFVSYGDAETLFTGIGNKLSTLKSGLTDLTTHVDGSATTYPYADVITIPDAVPSNLADCTVKIEPVQDLHGYDKPWVGGAGKNLIPLTVADIKASNTTGTWSGNVYTISTITVEILVDDANNVIGVKVNGTNNGSAIIFTLYRGDMSNVLVAGGTYTITDAAATDGRTQQYENTFTIRNDWYITDVAINRSILGNGTTYNNQIFYPQLETGDQATTFAPYTNICPISGHTEAVVTRCGNDVWTGDASYTRNDPGFIIRKTNISLPVGTYELHFEASSVNGAFEFQVYKNNSEEWGNILVNKSFNAKANNIVPFTINEAGTNVRMWSTNETGQTISNVRLYSTVNEYTIALGDTIYGGTVDFDSGVMTVDRAFIEYDGSSDENWERYSIGSAGAYAMQITNTALDNRSIPSSNMLVGIPENATWGNYDGFISILSGQNPGQHKFITGIKSITTVEDWTTYLSSHTLQVCYELATPTTIQLTPQQIQLLKGTNTLYASTGDISVTVNGVSGSIGAVQTQANDTNATLAELAEQLPTAPTTDGAYVLTVTVADGTPTYSWESAT